MLAKGGRPHRKLERMGASHLSRLVMLLVAPIILLACDRYQPASAILNCFTPNMFKLGKGGQPGGSLGGYGGPDRAQWYQRQPYPGYQTTQGAGYGAGGVQHPMKLLFQPKWKSGGSMFGAKGGWGSWKMGGSNFYRPGYGYGAGYMPPLAVPTPGGYQFSEQLNVAPFSVPSPGSSSSLGSPYSSQVTAAGAVSNDGWSVPLTYNNLAQAPIPHSQLAPAYDGYAPFQQPQQQHYGGGGKPSGQLVDPYSIKGGGSGANKLMTTKNVLLADGGYGFYDAHLMGGTGGFPTKNQTYGYAYPDWYSGGVVDSPARIAQQLLKQGLRRQRLQQQQQQPYQQHTNRSAPLLIGPGSANQFTILDEPRFVGYGTVDSLSNREARLSCSFNEAIDQTNRPLWVKFLGPYNSSQPSSFMTGGSKIVPPFNCANSQCRTQQVESTKDVRYKFDNGPATSTLIISEPRLSDYGIYRCSALTKAINNNPLETVYQIVQFGSLN